MSPSPRRKPAPPADTTDIDECDCGCGGRGLVVDRDELLDYFEAETTDDDRLALTYSLEAQAKGEAQLALEHYRSSLHVPGLPIEVMLETLALLGSQAPPWAVGRWVRAQAWWRMLLDGDARVDQAVRLALVTCFDISDMDGDDLQRCGTLRASSNRVAEEMALFHLGGFADYVDEHLSDELLALAPDLELWVGEPVKVYRHGSTTGRRSTVVDVRSGAEVEVYDVGSLDGVAAGDHVIGRVVPDGGGGLVFDARPLPVDELTAREVAQGPDRVDGDDDLETPWMERVFEARVAGRLPDGFGRPESHVLCDRPVVDALSSGPHPGLARLVEWSPARPSANRLISWSWK